MKTFVHMGRETVISPVVWVIGGSDCAAAAGVEADQRTLQAHGVHAAPLITALTAQNLGEIVAWQPTAPELFRQQMQALRDDLPPRVIKTGMLGSVAHIELLAQEVERLREVQATPPILVVDPVLGASSGQSLTTPESLLALKRHLLPLVDLLTPNLPEAAVLLGRSEIQTDQVEAAAEQLLALGARRVLLKGGHRTTGDLAQDYYTDGQESFWLNAPRRPEIYRGTGCTLASAVAAALAWGLEPADAVVFAKIHLNAALRQSQLRKNHAPRLLAMVDGAWASEDLPWLGERVAFMDDRPMFPTVGTTSLGFYPVVDRADWLTRLLPLGVTTAQLRIKDLTGKELEDELCKAIAIGRRHDCRLFINDHWQLAAKLGAYGVHLGQEDLANLDVKALLQTELRLGISTHSYRELAAAHALRPSYVALGPIFPTSCKSMRFGPQGFERIAEWHGLSACPVVAIGGLSLEHAASVQRRGADGIAVISDVTQTADPEARTRAWLAALS